MSSLVHIHSEMDRLEIAPDDDREYVWIRGRNDRVSLSLSREDRDALRAALDAVDAAESGASA